MQYERFELLLRVGFCFYDYAGDPPVTAYGFVVTGRGRFKIPRLTEVKFLLEVSVMLGSFSSEGRSAGILATVEAALSDQGLAAPLRPARADRDRAHQAAPRRGTATLDFTIETPWWLPDIHISHTWTFGGEPEIEAGGRAPAARARRAGARARRRHGRRPRACRCRPARMTRHAPYSLASSPSSARPAPGEEVFDGAHAGRRRQRDRDRLRGDRDRRLGTGETTPMAASRQENGEL